MMVMISSFYLFFSNFSKKLVPLLSLELLMILLITSMFYYNLFYYLHSFLLIFLIMMVLDSVLGLCMLVSSCRFSSSFNYKFM